jgi:FKBP-type peptidyl-prolyl cis-trans isomerase FklB
MMKWQWIAVCSLGLLVSFAIAQDRPAQQGEQPADAGLNTLNQKASYAIGLNIGRSIKEDDLDLDPKLIARGIQDAMSKDGKPLLTDQQLQAVMQEFQQQLQAQAQAKQQAQAEANMKKGEAFLAKNKEKEGVVTLKSGLQYEVLKKGDGQSPKASDTVTAHYHGTLLDGTVFDSSVQGGREPITIGVGQVIKGWTEALQLMKVGDKWRLYIPSDLAYGPSGSRGAIGPNETLIFEVELLGIESNRE